MSRGKWLFIIVLVAVIVYGSRSVLLQAPDFSYLNTLYDQSQWRIQASPRIISDNQLYQVAGRRLVTEHDFTDTNPEVPPFGKYVYGLADIYLGNPYWAALGWFLLSIVIFYWLAKVVLKKPDQVFTATVLFVLSPLFFSQITQTMLDGPQVALLLIHLLALFHLKPVSAKEQPWLHHVGWMGLAGVSFGLFAATKFPLFLAALVLTDLWWLFGQRRLIWSTTLFGIGALTYITTYLPFFLAGGTLGLWYANQKWMVAFYLTSQIKNVTMMAVITSMTGWYKGWWEDAGWQRIKEWAVVWPFGIVAMGRTLLHTLNHLPQSNYLVTLTICGLSLLTIQALTPFWPRYFLVILPLAMLVLTSWVSRWPGVRWLLIGLSLIQAILFLRPQPTDLESIISQTWKTGSYLDLYDHLDAQSRQSLNRQDFSTTLKEVEYQLQAKQTTATVETAWVPPWSNHTTGEMTVTYQTPLGSLTTVTPVELLRQENVWKLDWQWSSVLPEFDPGDEVILELQVRTGGNILAKSGEIVSTVEDRAFVFVVPQEIEDLDTTLQAVFEATEVPMEKMKGLLLVKALPHHQVPIAFAMPEDDVQLAELDQKPGVVLQQQPKRIFNSVLVEKKLFSFMESLETQYPQVIAQPQGMIILRQNDEPDIILLQTPGQDGTTVTLDMTWEDILKLPSDPE